MSAKIHSNKDLRDQSCRYDLVFSQPSKLGAFISLFQMHHIKQEMIKFQMILKSFRPILLFQQAKRSTTRLSITQYSTLKNQI